MTAIHIGIVRHKAMVRHRHGHLAPEQVRTCLDKCANPRIDHAANRFVTDAKHNKALLMDFTIVHDFSELDDRAGYKLSLKLRLQESRVTCEEIHAQA